MNTQSDKNRRTKILTISLAMSFILAGGGLLAAYSFGDEVIGPTVLFLSALCLSVIAAWSRKNRWTLIPAGLSAIVGLGVALGILFPESEATGLVFMFLFALCFSIIAAWSRKNRWAIIPAGLFATIGLVDALDILVPQNEATGPVFMFLLAATFIAFAVLSKKNWWAIIPAGLFASVGLVVALDILVPHEAYPSLPGTVTWGFYTCVLFLGLATTFGVLWLLRKILPTSWAIYPAAGFLTMAVLFIIEGAHYSEYWLQTMLLVFGLMLLLAVLTGKRTTAGPQVPKVKA